MRHHPVSLRANPSAKHAQRQRSRRLFFEGLESRKMLDADASLDFSPWQNAAQPLDTNADTEISPIDFLVVVNALHEDLRVGRTREEAALGTADSEGVYPDVNGDNFITSLDALLLANWLHKQLADANDDVFAAGPVSSANSPSTAEHIAVSLQSESAGEGNGVVCDTPAMTVSAPSDVDEYTIFTVSGSAKHAETILVTATGSWALVAMLGSKPGFTFNSETGAFSQMLIFKDDAPAGTAEDLETITVTASGACGDSQSVDIMVHNTDVQASVKVEPAIIEEGETVKLTVDFTDAVLDGFRVWVDWGDGQITSIDYPDQLPNLPGIIESIPFLEAPPRVRLTTDLTHQYIDDDPTATPRDKYVVKVTVSDNDLSTTTVNTTVVVNNADPEVTIDRIIPIDNQVRNEQIDETEGFRVVGTVTDRGVADTHKGKVKADLNWDGDFNDPGEQIGIAGGVGRWQYDVTFSGVPDDGPWPGNQTSNDDLKIEVEVFDDDTGRAFTKGTANVVNYVPRVYWDVVTMTYSRDASGNIDEVTITGSFNDIGQQDVHQLGVVWGDGARGNGTTNDLPISGRTFSVTRRLPPSFGDSIRRVFPIKLGVRDDDLGTDRGELEGKIHWSFVGANLAIETKDLTPQYVQPLVSPSLAGAKWKGYGESLISEVQDDTNAITGFANGASALAFPGVVSGPDFNANLPFRTTSKLDFMITCDRVTGSIGKEINGGGGGNAILLDKDGTFLGWDYTTSSLPQVGPLGTSTRIEVGISSSPGEKTVEIDLEAHFGVSANVTVINESGPQIDGPGGKIVIKQGSTSSYPSGLEDIARVRKTYKCIERLKLIKSDTEN